jgi:hypothetical protein
MYSKSFAAEAALSNKNNLLFYMYKLNHDMSPVGASLLAIWRYLQIKSIVGAPNRSKD